MSDFWSRRRAAVEAEVEAEAQVEAAAIEAARKTERETELAEKTDEELLAELDLPDPDSLGSGDDFTVFLKEAVPARLKTRALRRLWGTNPLLANIDGLVDYGEDFTDAAMAVENIQTAYQVGKGMTAHVEELARQAELEAAEDAAGEDTDADLADAQNGDGSADHGFGEDAPADDPAQETAPQDMEQISETPAVALAEEPGARDARGDSVLEEDAPVAEFAPPRRMRFAFGEDGEVPAI